VDDHGFNILDDRGDDGDPVVHVETLTNGLTITDPDDVAAYKESFARLRRLAITGTDAQALLRQIAASADDPRGHTQGTSRREEAGHNETY
jgi:hypothetical protein